MNKHTLFDNLQPDEMVVNLQNVQSLSEMERKLRELLKRIGNILLHLWLVWQTPRYKALSVTCPYCGGQAAYIRQRKGTLRTMFGIIHYRRAYYLCQACQQGHYPLDNRLGLRPNALSVEVERLAGMVGVQMPFEQGRVIFEALTLVKLSDHSLAQATQTYGQQVVDQERHWQAVAEDETEVARVRRTPLRL